MVLTFMEVFCNRFTCTPISSLIHWNNSELKQVTCTAIIPQGEVVSRIVQWAASTRDNRWIVWISHIGDFNNVPKVWLYSSNVQCKWGYPVEMYCESSSGRNFKIVDRRWWTLMGDQCCVTEFHKFGVKLKTTPTKLLLLKYMFPSQKELFCLY